jgi:hypothetical protein
MILGVGDEPESSSGNGKGIGIATGVVGAAVLLLGALYITLKRRRYVEPHVIEKTRTDGSELHLDADGDVLSQAMSPSMDSQGSSSPSFGGDDSGYEVESADSDII